jgi:hypothetical protein
MQLLVGSNRFLELPLAYVTPRAHGVADNFDFEFRHLAKGWPEHANLTRIINIIIFNGKEDKSWE